MITESALAVGHLERDVDPRAICGAPAANAVSVAVEAVLRNSRRLFIVFNREVEIRVEGQGPR